MPKLDPYLNFDGNTEEAFDFYKSVFGGEFDAVMRWKDNPQCEEWSDSDKEKIMHISLPLAGGNFLMGSDAIEMMGKKFAAGNNFQIAISPESRDEADRLFNGLSAGGTVIMPMQPMFWGSYWGALADKFGTQWMIDYAEPKQDQ